MVYQAPWLKPQALPVEEGEEEVGVAAPHLLEEAGPAGLTAAK
jgi:hypothetical protein